MRPQVVVVGGGFGGLNAVRALARANVDVTLVDRRNFHLFQPLVYQVATGGLSAVEIAAPLRQVVRRQRNAEVVLAEVTGFDLDSQSIAVEHLPNGGGQRELHYDALVVAGGSRYSYFGHDEWAEHAPEPKSLEGALELRNRILRAFEAAEVERDEEARAAWLTFVVVGAGPTGVEIAGQIAELARNTLRREYRAADTRRARVLLVEAGERVLPAFPPSLSRRGETQLQAIGVAPMLQSTVVGIDAGGVYIQTTDGGRLRLSAKTAIWAAGVTASPLAGLLASAAGGETDRAGRIVVENDLTVPGRPNVFAIGDMVAMRGQTLPGLAPVAIQQGRYVARSIRDSTRAPFRYRDKGNLATIGRARAVADINGLHLSGFIAWAIWLSVHIVYLIGFQNRVVVLTRWMFSYFTRGRAARVIHSA